MRATNITRMALAVPAAALLAACGGSSSGGNTVAAGDATPSFNDHGSTTVSGDTVEIEADDFYFSPSVITGTPGEEITVKLANGSGTEHNFSVDSQDVDVDIEAHEDVTTTVTIPASGFVSFYCSYHKSQGMAGVLESKT